MCTTWVQPADGGWERGWGMRRRAHPCTEVFHSAQCCECGSKPGSHLHAGTPLCWYTGRVVRARGPAAGHNCMDVLRMPDDARLQIVCIQAHAPNKGVWMQL